MLYHIDVYMPSFVWHYVPRGERKLSFTKHAVSEANKDGLPICDSADFSRAKLIEVAVEDGLPVKFVFRFAYTEWHDIVLVVIPVEDLFLVKTMWSNHVNDRHFTLDKTKYERGVAL